MPNVCLGLELSQIQSVSGTAVGVGFIFPVIVQILSERNNKLVSRANLLLSDLKRDDDRAAMFDLANVLTAFQQQLDVSEQRAGKLIALSAVSAFLAYLILVWSQFQPQVCMSLAVASSVTGIISLPVGASFYYFFRWYDSSRQLIARYNYYYSR